MLITPRKDIYFFITIIVSEVRNMDWSDAWTDAEADKAEMSALEVVADKWD